MKIGLLQLALKDGQPQNNRKKVIDLLEKEMTSSIDVLVLPELWDTGYALDKLEIIADHEGEKAKTFLCQLAKTYQCNIVGGSIARESKGLFYNTSYTFDQKGNLIGQYDKIHLFGLMEENQYIQAGNQETHFNINDIEMSQVICYDIRFPEWTRKLMANGSKILFVSAQWPSSRIKQWTILLQARAIENQAFVVAVNRTGEGLLDDFNGHSMVINPLGDIVTELNNEERLAVVDIDLSLIDQVRGQMPVFEDRRPNLYKED